MFLFSAASHWAGHLIQMVTDGVVSVAPECPADPYVYSSLVAKQSLELLKKKQL